MKNRRSMGLALLTVLGIALLLLAAAAATGGWQPGWLPGLTARLGGSWPATGGPGQGLVSATSARLVPAAQAGARKCRTATGVIYTDQPCPPGSREEAVAQGSLTVLPAAPAVRPAAVPASASGSLLREWAGSDGEMRNMREQMREQMIEQVTR